MSVFITSRCFTVFMCAAGLAWTLSTCRARNNSELKRVEHEDTAPEGSDTWTKQRVVTLNNWAEELLQSTRDDDDFQTQANKELQRLGVTDAKPLNNYALFLRPGDECFSDKGKRGTKSLWWNSSRDAIRAQLVSAAQFITDFHVAMLGRPQGPLAFRSLEICPESVTGKRFYLKGQTLVVGLTYSRLTGFKTFTSDELRAMWDQGEHLTGKPSFFSGLFSQNKLNKLWLVFNPIGPVRVGLRSFLQEQGSALEKRLQLFLQTTFGKGPGANLAASLGDLGDVSDTAIEELQKLIHTSTDAELLAAQGLTSASLTQTLAALQTKNQIPLLLANWLCAAKNPSLSDDLSHAAVSRLEQTMREGSSDVSVSIRAGLVAVGNYHQIGVSFTAAVGAFDEFLIHPTTEGNSLKLRADVQGGLVSVYTIDEIHVDATIGFLQAMTGKSQGTAALHTAIAAARNGNSLCSK